MPEKEIYTINPKAWIKYKKSHYRCYIGENPYDVDDSFASIFFNLHGSFFKKDDLFKPNDINLTEDDFNQLVAIKLFILKNKKYVHTANNDKKTLRTYPGLSSYQMHQASKNGRVYQSRINRKKYIFKFQTTRNEISFLQDFNFAFAPKILDYNFDKKFYIQEHIHGISLYEWKSNFYKKSDIKNILKQILHIERTLNQNNIIHGDIHPHNFIIKNKNIYLIDWDNAFKEPLSKTLKKHIKATGMDGFCHPDIKKGNLFPNQKTQNYSFNKINEYLIHSTKNK